MKTPAVFLTAIVLNSLAVVPLVQAAAPGVPEANGLIPKSATIYVNPTASTINNNAVGSAGVAIADNGNVLVGWSDAVLTDPLTLLGLQRGVWTLYDINGNSLTATQTITSVAPPGVFNPNTIDTKFLALYRADGTLTPGNVMEMMKVKANLFGPGLGVGGTTDYALLEFPELAAINTDDSPPDPLFGLNANSFAIVQLLNNDGTKAANVLSGFTDTDAQPDGGARIGDWEYLSNGNILIVTENRQPTDLVTRFGGSGPGQHVVFRILKPDGTEVKGLTLASDEAVQNGMWHGAGVTQGRFALRFDQGGAKVRIFNNDGSPVTGNIDLGVLAGNPLVSQGGRGDETGFHGNGVDAFVNVNSAVDAADGIRKAFITVFNHNGVLRYSRVVTDDADMVGTSRVDGAIDASGRAIAVYEDTASAVNASKIIRGRLFGRTGSPLGGTFNVSDTETADAAVSISQRPRVAWRGDKIAIVWESKNNPAEAGIAFLAARFFAVAALGTPQDGGLTPQSGTFYVNTADTINNGGTESLGVSIARNGNVILGWEDDGSELTDLEAVWTMYDSAGTLLIAPRTISTLTGPNTINSSFLSFFRSDGTPIAGYTAWGPKIKANLFGNGIGMGATAFAIGLEIPELADINIQIGDGSPGDFPAVQLLNNDGTPLNSSVLSGYSDTDADVPGDVRIADWEYLSDGNIVIVGESRQQSDLVDRFGGAAGGNHATFRIVRPDGSEVKALTLVSDAAEPNEIWHGVGVTRDGFAVRFAQGGAAKVRLFRNDGTPVTENLDMGTLTGNAAIASGGRGDSTGFHGNGADAYVMANSGVDATDQIRKAFITVLNTDGIVRYSRAVSDDVPLGSSDRVDAAIDNLGRVVAVYDDAAGTANNVRLVRARLFNSDGTPGGSTFYVSEVETPASVTFPSQGPRVAIRNNLVAIVWESENNPNTTSALVAGRIYRIATSEAPQDNGLTPASSTFYVNTSDTINNGGTESLGVSIANNGNVVLAWEDDGSGLTDLEAVWTLYSPTGQPLITPKSITTLTGPDTITSSFLSFFRSDGTPISGYTAWGPKMHANLYGDGIGMGATAFAIGLEIPELADINIQIGDGSPGDFPAVQLLKNDGTPLNQHVLSGYSDTDADVSGDVRVADWEYLSDGNIVIVGESRQQADLVDRFGGTVGGNHAAFRIVRPDGSEVKGLSLASDSPTANSMWHGVGSVRGGFAVRFDQGGGKIRIFNNDGTPRTENIDLAVLTGNPAIAEGGRGDSVGFHGNGNDAYLLVNTGLDAGDGIRKAFVTVINADGTLRYSRPVSDDIALSGSDRTDGGIDSLGRVVAVFDDAAGVANNVRVVRGRLFNANGTPAGGTFYVSEVETPAEIDFASSRPRAAFRGNEVAIVWESQNNPNTTSAVVAGRIFTVSGPASTVMSITEAGADVRIEWVGGGTLQGAPELSGPWTPIAGAASPYTTAASGALRFFRVR